MDILLVLSMLVTRFKLKLILKYLKYSADFNIGTPFLLCHGYWGCPLLFSKVLCHCALHCQKCKICPAARTSLRYTFAIRASSVSLRWWNASDLWEKAFWFVKNIAWRRLALRLNELQNASVAFLNLLHTRLAPVFNKLASLEATLVRNYDRPTDPAVKSAELLA